MDLDEEQLAYANQIRESWISAHPEYLEAKKNAEAANEAQRSFKPIFDENPTTFVIKNHTERAQLAKALADAKALLEKKRSELDRKFSENTRAFRAQQY